MKKEQPTFKAQLCVFSNLPDNYHVHLLFCLSLLVLDFLSSLSIPIYILHLQRLS